MRPEDIRAVQWHAREVQKYERVARDARRAYDQLAPSLPVAASAAASVEHSGDIVNGRPGAVPSRTVQRAVDRWTRGSSERTLFQVEPRLLDTAMRSVSAGRLLRVRGIIEAHRLSMAIDTDLVRSAASTAAVARRVRMLLLGIDHDRLAAVCADLVGVRLSPAHAAMLATPIAAGRGESQRNLSGRRAPAPPPAVIVAAPRGTHFADETDSGIVVPTAQPLADQPQPVPAPSGLHVVEGDAEDRFNAITDAIEADTASQKLSAALEEATAALNANTAAKAQIHTVLLGLIEVGNRIHNRLPSNRSTLVLNLVSGLVVLAFQIYYPAALRPATSETPPVHETRQAPAPQPNAPLCLPRQSRPASAKRDAPDHDLREAA